MLRFGTTSTWAHRLGFRRNRGPQASDRPTAARPRARRGHRAGAGPWCGVFSGGPDHGRPGRASPSNHWIRRAEPTIVAHDADYRITPDDRAAIRAGKALFFAGRALAKADLVCAKQGGREILWYWVARRACPWVVEDLLLPDRQQATAGTCYASPEMVLAVSRCARRSGWLILGAGHSHGHLGVFSSSVDLELMSQLAAERVGFASRTQRMVAGSVAKQNEAPTADDSEEADRPPVAVFEITFDDDPDVWLTVAARADLPDGALDAKLHLVHRHQASFFTTHNAEGDRYFPVHHVTACLHCGTRLEDHTSEDVEIHVIGPETLTEDEETDLIAELEQKAPRGAAFAERWGWRQVEMHPTVEAGSPEPPQAPEDESAETPADFFVYRHGRREGKVPAPVLEEAAYRCPALARALGWDEPRDDASPNVPGDRDQPPTGDAP